MLLSVIAIFIDFGFLNSKIENYIRIGSWEQRVWRVKVGMQSTKITKIFILVPETDTNACQSITFERIPSDYAILKIIKTPEDTGGDTLWASGYEAFDRLSPTWQRFAETLTATHYQVNSHDSRTGSNVHVSFGN